MSWLQRAGGWGELCWSVECTSAVTGALHFVFGANTVLVYLFGSSKSPKSILSGYFEFNSAQPGRRASK